MRISKWVVCFLVLVLPATLVAQSAGMMRHHLRGHHHAPNRPPGEKEDDSAQ